MNRSIKRILSIALVLPLLLWSLSFLGSLPGGTAGPTDYLLDMNAFADGEPEAAESETSGEAENADEAEATGADPAETSGAADDRSADEAVPDDGTPEEAATEESSEEIAEEDPLEARAQEILAGMSLKDKIGQLFMVRPDQVKKGGKSVKKLTPQMKKRLKKYRIGGVIMFGNNISSPKQIKAFNKALTKASYEYSGLPMMISVDEEGGRITRLAYRSNFKVTKFKSMLAIGRTGNTYKAFKVGRTIGKYLKKYGFTADMAPVADCFTNPKNTVIGDRSFGSDPELVSDMVYSAINGFHRSGIMTTLKHYPGHGDTKADTHKQTVKVRKSWKSLKKLELVPFIENLDHTDMIMASHIRCTGISKTIAPTSISKTMIQKKLRNQLGYDGVVITDAMEMDAISQNYSPAEAAVRAIIAGCDIILCPDNLSKSFNGIRDAVKSGRISEERLNESVLRIIRLKLKYSGEFDQ